MSLLRPLIPSGRKAGFALSGAGALTLLSVGLLIGTGGSAVASVQDRLDRTEQKISEANQEKGVLTSQIAGLNDRIGAFETQVAALRVEERAAERRLAAKQAELDDAQAEFDSAYRELKLLARKLEVSLDTLRERLVAIYEGGTTSIADIVLASADYGDLVERSEYFEQIQNSDESLIVRVRSLRDRQKELVVRLKSVRDRIRKVRNVIAEEERGLQAARTAVQNREQKLLNAKNRRQQALNQVNAQMDHLEGIQADLQAKIQQQIAEASGFSLPAGPMSAPSAAGLVWPLSGTLTSGFGYRWGRMHEGIDIAVPEGTPIRAAKGGTVIIASYMGGYGNYTCIDHGGGLSTCYGHQAGYAVSSGQRVSQGQVIGYSGNTGASTGPHLHFEVRINGAAQDPMGYL